MLNFQDHSIVVNLLIFALGAVLVWLAGTKLSKYVDLFADRTGLGKAFAGALLLGGATSLPEVSTTYSAVRFGAYSMAAANILGTNSMEIALFLPAELGYRDRPIFDAMHPSAAFLGAIGIVVTSLYLWGILERRDRTVLGMGVDSLVVLFVYLSGLAIYWTL